jgi:SanA protein
MLFRLIKYFILLIVLMSIAVIYLNHYVKKEAQSNLYTDISKVPAKKAVLVLGTAKFFRGKKNYFYDYRIRSAIKLFKANKVKAILV